MSSFILLGCHVVRLQYHLTYRLHFVLLIRGYAQQLWEMYLNFLYFMTIITKFNDHSCFIHVLQKNTLPSCNWWVSQVFPAAFVFEFSIIYIRFAISSLVKTVAGMMHSLSLDISMSVLKQINKQNYNKNYCFRSKFQLTKNNWIIYKSNTLLSMIYKVWFKMTGCIIVICLGFVIHLVECCSDTSACL